MPRSPDAALAWAAEQLGPCDDVRPLFGGRTSTLLALAHRDGGAVLRLVDREPWRRHGEQLTARERATQEWLEDTDVPAPRSIALDAAGERCGDPAHLMTLLPGEPRPARAPWTAGGLDALAALLADVHAVAVAPGTRVFESWAWPAKHVVPTWASDAGPWRAAFDLLAAPAPAYEPTFLHRDFGAHNTLWRDGRVSGVVDWVETSVGPAWLDVAHASTNLALDHGDEVADRFAAAYAERTGRTPAAYWDVMDVVGFLPPPGREGFVTDPLQQQRLDQRLRTVLARIDRVT